MAAVDAVVAGDVDNAYCLVRPPGYGAFVCLYGYLLCVVVCVCRDLSMSG